MVKNLTRCLNLPEGQHVLNNQLFTSSGLLKLKFVNFAGSSNHLQAGVGKHGRAQAARSRTP
jgi:hypothetical protein